jgi:hypothetical protein
VAAVDRRPRGRGAHGRGGTPRPQGCGRPDRGGISLARPARPRAATPAAPSSPRHVLSASPRRRARAGRRGRRRPRSRSARRRRSSTSLRRARRARGSSPPRGRAARRGRAQRSGAVKPPSECPTTTRSLRSPTAWTTVSAYSHRPAESSSLGRSTAMGSWPCSRSSDETRCQSHAVPPPPWMSANVDPETSSGGGYGQPTPGAGAWTTST